MPAQDQRIVSLVPSLTELLIHFGLGATLVGRTRFCTEPAEAVAAIPIIGGTKNPNVHLIAALQPSLVVANKEENRREDIEALRSAGVTVVVTDPNTVDEAAQMVFELSVMLGVRAIGERLVAAIHEEAAGGPAWAIRAFVPIWKRPWLGLGSQTYGHDLLRLAGFENVLAGRARYPEVTLDEVAALQPEVILLPDEPYPFSTKDGAAFEGIAPSMPIDGKLLWWYGPRMPASIRELRRIAAELRSGSPAGPGLVAVAPPP